MLAIAQVFEANGHSITHKWWEVEDLPEWRKSSDELERQAKEDLKGVLTSQRVILLNTKKSEGKAVEQGIAIAAGIPIIAIGKLGEMSANVFHYLKDSYTWVDDLTGALQCLLT